MDSLPNLKPVHFYRKFYKTLLFLLQFLKFLIFKFNARVKVKVDAREITYFIC